ncbi:MAG: hypothetical protein IJS32_09010 [Kiritimatiellae bacterium]|nr:hypothetical protein [Kiritimatiellia bacterium]
MPGGGNSAPRVRWHRFPRGWRVGLAAEIDAPETAGEVLRLLGETLPADARPMAESRHRLDRVAVSLAGKPFDLAVKTYAPQARWRDALARLALAKAAHAFLAAERLHAAGVGTPAPVAVLEKWRGGKLLLSRFASVFLDNLTDLRVELDRLLSRDPPEAADIIALLETVAPAVKAFHDAGLLHCDLGNQNIALSPKEGGGWRVSFLDLNRARFVSDPSPAARGKDLARLDIPSDLRRCFFAMYHAGFDPPKAFTRAERREREAFDRHTALRPFRHPWRAWKNRNAPKEKRPPLGKDLWIWDERSAQPVQAYVSRERRKWMAAGNVLRAIPPLVFGGPALKLAERRAAEDLRSVVDLSRLGLSLDADSATWAVQKRFLAELEGNARIPLHLRVLHHQGPAGWERTARFAEELANEGHEVALSLVQSRAAVREPESWEKMLRDTLERTHAFAAAYFVCHAPNRTKWGIWDYRELARLVSPVRDLKARFPEAKFCAPGCIDFEPHALAAALSVLPEEPVFSALAHALYVDRRGDPDNTQGGYDTAKKIALLGAFAEKCRAIEGGKVVLTEVNWPLAGTGPWSPVTSPYETKGPRKNDPSVTETQYAIYMAKYIRTALSSKRVERLYWWRLAAHGFGLVDLPPDGSPPRARPAFDTFRNLVRQPVR